MSSAPVRLPKDGQIITDILKDLAINDFDSRVTNQLLDYMYTYSTSMLNDARGFAHHAKKKNVDVDDIKLAIQMYAENTASFGLPRDILLNLAQNKNSIRLPVIKPQFGMRLPPDRYCLTQPNYKLKASLSNQ